MGTLRVGVIGAGQLGRMLALAAYPLGVSCRFLDSYPEAPGGQLAPMRVAELDDEKEIRALAGEVDVMTFDIENVSVAALEAIESIVPVRPSRLLVEQAQDRLLEKRLFESLGMPTAPYVVIDEPGDLERAAESIGWPIVLKARRLGYDGRGQRIASTPEELRWGWQQLGHCAAIAEGWIDFDVEVSLIGVRGVNQSHAFYPLSENRHRDGMLTSSIAPFANTQLAAQAQAWMSAMMDRHRYRGVLTIEFFVAGDDLIANEIAPRVHNSGHWTIEGAETSQFENHIRAILGLPLGRTASRGTSVMRNLIGEVPPPETLLGVDGVHLHDYGKSARPGRKVGHCTVVAANRETALARLEEIETVINGAESD